MKKDDGHLNVSNEKKKQSWCNTPKSLLGWNMYWEWGEEYKIIYAHLSGEASEVY
jgi:hypothetical protein